MRSSSELKLIKTLSKNSKMGDKFEQTDRFVQGLQIRKEVLGDAYVEKALQGVSNFASLLVSLGLISCR